MILNPSYKFKGLVQGTVSIIYCIGRYDCQLHDDAQTLKVQYGYFFFNLKTFDYQKIFKQFFSLFTLNYVSRQTEKNFEKF